MVFEENQRIEDLTRFATDVVGRLGKQALSYYGKGNSDIRFDEELITAAELHLTKFFIDELNGHYPEHQLFQNTQENKAYTHEDRRYLWIYDPIDGVDNFQTGIPIWGISLALLDNFWPILGLFYMPVTGDLFHARADQPAYRGKEKISVSDQKNLDNEGLLFTYSRFHQHYTCKFPGKIRDMGCTTAHICYVATGRADAAIIANESYQGLAAARVIIEAAGGNIFQMDGSGFFLNEYLDGQKIDDHLLVVAPANFSSIHDCLQKTI